MRDWHFPGCDSDKPLDPFLDTVREAYRDKFGVYPEDDVFIDDDEEMSDF